MNTDDFEKRLQCQSMRPVPREWRGEILDAARRAGDRPLSTLRNKATAGDGSTTNPQPTSWWRELLWPCPQAWAGLAAIWGVILMLNLTSRDPVQLTTTSNTVPAQELLIALGEHRRLLAELIGTPPVIEPVKPSSPRPRSEISQPTFSIRFA